MSIQLDNLDRRILQLLELDARKSKSVIADRLKVNKAIVTYRINRLLKNGVITGYQYFVNEAKLGATSYGLLLKFEGLLLPEQENLLKQVRAAKIFDWAVLTSGTWEAIAVSVVKSPAVFTQTLDHFFERFGQYIKRHAFYMDYQGSISDHNYLYNQPDSKTVQYSHAAQKVSLPQVQRDILVVLSKHPTMSLLGIADRLGKTYDTVQVHYRALITNGVLLKCVPIIDHQLLGYKNTMCFYTLKPEPGRISDFWKACLAHPSIVRQARCLGNFSIVLNLHSQTERELKEITSLFQKEFSDSIIDYTVLRIVD